MTQLSDPWHPYLDLVLWDLDRDTCPKLKWKLEQGINQPKCAALAGNMTCNPENCPKISHNNHKNHDTPTIHKR